MYRDRVPLSARRVSYFARARARVSGQRHFVAPAVEENRRACQALPDGKLLETHRLAEFAPHLLGLPVVPAEIGEQVFPERMSAVLLERHALGVELAPDVGQGDARVLRGIADHALGVLAPGDGVEVPEELPAQHRD